jgi:uncharacterized surface protein with fasciclin (FAS1) repeats
LAFGKIPQLLLKGLLANPKALDQVLELHIISGKIFAKDLKDGEQLKTVVGGILTVSITGGKVAISSAGTKIANVIVVDNEATNGVVHIVDHVLFPSILPGSGTIAATAAATADLSTLVTALKAGDLVDTLSGPGPFTVFAPTNEAFAALPAGVLSNLLKPENKTQLVDILTYHVVSGNFQAADLKDGQMLKTVEGKSVTVRLSAKTVLINSAEVTTANVEASNGVIHIIDGVLLPSGVPPVPGPPPPAPPAPPPAPTIAEIAAATPDLSTLVTALKAGDLVDTLSGPGPFSVFAPTNNAFAALPAGVLANLLKPENKTQLVDILTYHVLASNRSFNKQYPRYDQKLTFPTVEGRNVSVAQSACGGGNRQACTFILSGLKKKLRFKEEPVFGSNGVVYIIDAVLMPPPRVTIVDLAVREKDLSTLVTALKAGDLVDTLSGPGPFTVFAPTNEAFAALPAGVLTTLLLPQNKATLVDVLTYHVVAGTVHGWDLKDGQMLTTVEGKNLTVTLISGGFAINGNRVNRPNLDTDNGVVHIIGGVLLPNPNATLVGNQISRDL